MGSREDLGGPASGRMGGGAAVVVAVSPLALLRTFALLPVAQLNTSCTPAPLVPQDIACRRPGVVCRRCETVRHMAAGRGRSMVDAWLEVREQVACHTLQWLSMTLWLRAACILCEHLKHIQYFTFM